MMTNNSGEDYIGKDGLLYCGRCHAPKQFKYSLFGTEKVVDCLCECGNDDAGKEERIRRAKLEAMLDLSSDKLNNGNKLTQCRFSLSVKTKDVITCKNYAERFDEMMENRSGLLLWGSNKEDLTVLTACIANELIEKGRTVAMTTFPRILCSGFSTDELVKELEDYDLLLFDRFTLRDKPDDYKVAVIKMLQRRREIGKPIVIATDMELDEFSNQTEEKAVLICRLVKQMCYAIKITEPEN